MKSQYPFIRLPYEYFLLWVKEVSVLLQRKMYWQCGTPSCQLSMDKKPLTWSYTGQNTNLLDTSSGNYLSKLLDIDTEFIHKAPGWPKKKFNSFKNGNSILIKKNMICFLYDLVIIWEGKKKLKTCGHIVSSIVFFPLSSKKNLFGMSK